MLGYVFLYGYSITSIDDDEPTTSLAKHHGLAYVSWLINYFPLKILKDWLLPAIVTARGN